MCGPGRAEFTDRYRISDSGLRMIPIPAWVCNLCRYAEPARAEHQPDVLRARAKEIRADARRKLMKSRFVRQRAERARLRSLSRKRR
jgi:hypothetical protein